MIKLYRMKRFTILFLSLAFLDVRSASAQVLEKDVKKVFAPKGNHRSPFKGAGELGLTSVNLQFKLASRETIEKRGAGNVVSWAFLEGISDELMQEIADEYYKRLEQRFSTLGIRLSDAYKNTDQYQSLLEKSADRSRETNKKNWGVAKVFTANNGPYIEFPIGLMGPHAGLGNSLKIPIGQVLITIDFAEFLLKITKGVTDFQGMIKTESKSTLIPKIRIEGMSQVAKMRGDGSYALFTGKNWGYTNAVVVQALESQKPYAIKTEGAKGMPESMKKFKSAVVGDLVGIFSRGVVGNGRATGEFTYTVQADPNAYKVAVLDALDTYNDYLIAYINGTR